MKTHYKYKLEVYFESEEPFSTVDDVLTGSWLYDQDFRGAITSSKLVERK